MLKIAWRNLVHERTRMAISVGGIALAVILILVMSGVFAGSEEHAVLYMKKQPASLWLMQAGVENMHMSSSILPPETVEQVRGVDGVGEAVGLLYANAGIDLGETIIYSYIFAVDGEAPFGGPWELAEGTADPALDEIVLDRDLARRYGMGLGSTVNVLGYDLSIAGLSEGTFGIATSISFVNKQALSTLMGVSPEAASYVLIQPEPGIDQDVLARRLRSAAPDSNLMSRDDFIASDQEMIRQMGVDIIRAMNGVAYVVGMLVIGLTIYTATVERAREYGVLKAIGANSTDLLRVVFSQAYLSAGLGFIIGVGLSYLLAALISRLLPEMLVVIRPLEALEQLPVLVVITGLAALLPISRISRLDPMVVFQE